MSLTVIGWAVVHSLWQGMFIAGVAAMALGLLRDPRARARYLVACVSLAIMALMALATALSGELAIGFRLRQQVLFAIDDTIAPGIPFILRAAALIVPAAGALWLAGVAVGVVRVGLEWRRVQRLGREELGEAGPEIRTIVTELCGRMAVSPRVAVRSSTQALVPMVLGWRRPLILLPERIAAALSPAQLRAVLAHELAHVRRGDYLANLIQVAADTLLFHHPAARWLSRRIRTEREYCCDDEAVRIGNETATYARALAALEDARGGYRLAVAAASGTLLDRIQRIAGQPRPMLTPARGAIALVVASLIAGVLLSIAIIVPPSIPVGAQLRRRMPAPEGMVLPRSPQKLPRSRVP